MASCPHLNTQQLHHATELRATLHVCIIILIAGATEYFDKIQNNRYSEDRQQYVVMYLMSSFNILFHQVKIM